MLSVFIIMRWVTCVSGQGLCLTPPPHPEHGKVLSNWPLVGTSVVYVCDKGYRLKGTNIRQCIPLGYWEGSAPVCEFVGECPVPKSIENGYIVSHDHSNTVGSFALYDCTPFYTLEGPRTRQCLSSLQWSDTEPKCVVGVPECVKLPPIANGHVRTSGVNAGSIAVYTCDEGFILIGYSQRVCYPDNRWSNEEPRCTKVSYLMDCPPLELVAHGQVIVSGENYGSRATYTCDFGYRLIGTDKRKCLSDGSWSGSNPYCLLVKNICADLRNPVNGYVKIEGNLPGSYAVYTCKDGFELRGSSRRLCIGYGEWTNSAPTCEKNCPDLLTLHNGHVSITGLLVGSVATYICKDGYALVGYRNRTCEQGGIWQDTFPPRCAKIPPPVFCAPPPSIRNGIVTTNGDTKGAVTKYACDSGYSLVGSIKRSCLGNSTWSGTEPECSRDAVVICKKPFSVENGRIYFDDLLTGSSLVYSCNKGFHLVGKETRTCLDNGEWSYSAPECAKLAECEELLPIQNGKVHMNDHLAGSTAYYTCGTGYYLDQDPSFLRLCMADGYWAGVQPSCNIIHCKKLLQPNRLISIYYSTDSLVPGTVAQYICPYNFNINGSNIRECVKGGKWNGTEPSCIKIPDGSPGVNSADIMFVLIFHIFM